MHLFLIRTIATLTKTERYIPRIGIDFEWSSQSWTHNLFRVFEIIFGREVGIRAESTTAPDGNGGTLVFCHSIEAICAYTETYVRNLFRLPTFRFVKVWVPRFAPVGIPISPYPYLLAIAFDNATSGDTASGTTATISHTCTGSNLTLIIGGLANSASATVTATYNSVSATSAVSINDTTNGYQHETLYLANPATGAHNIVVTSTVSANVTGLGTSLTGTAASPLGATANTNSTHTSTPSQAITSGTANSWLVDTMNAIGTLTTPLTATGTNQTSRIQITTAANAHFVSSTETTTTAGSYTMSWSLSAAKDTTYAVIEIKPFVAPAANGNFLAFM